MKPRRSLLVCTLVSALAVTGIAPAAPPVATSSAGEPAFEEIQSVVHLLLGKTSRGGAASGSPSQPPADGQTSAAGAAAAPSAPGTAVAPGGTTVERFQFSSAPGSAGGETTHIAWDAGDPAVYRLLSQSSADLAYLRGLSASIGVPNAYAENVRQHEAVLLSLGAQKRLTPQGLAKLQAVTADLHVKAVHAQKITNGAFGAFIFDMLANRAFISGAFSPIQVRAHTIKQGKETGGYEVWYVAAAYDDDPSRFQRFLRLSSPTSLPLTVGNYSMWATAPGGATGTHVILAIGAGAPTQDLDLSVP
jgi:hypothetical protein